MKRLNWVIDLLNIDSNRLVFIDETSVTCGLTRHYGRSRNGERVNDYVPDKRYERITLISSIRLSGEQSPFLFKSTLDGDLFSVYVRDILAPTLKQDDIVVLDNSSVTRLQVHLLQFTIKKHQ